MEKDTCMCVWLELCSISDCLASGSTCPNGDSRKRHGRLGSRQSIIFPVVTCSVFSVYAVRAMHTQRTDSSQQSLRNYFIQMTSKWFLLRYGSCRRRRR